VKTATAGKTRLHKETLVDRAIDVADSEGLEAVTMRRLAQELRVSPMALYWHCADKDALLAAMSERLWDETAAELDTAPPAGDDWSELHRLTACLVAVLRRHRGCAELAPLAVLTCESGLALTERALTLLSADGLPPERAAESAHFLLATAITVVSTQPGGQVSLEDHEAKIRAKRVALASLPQDRYPHVAAMAALLVDCPDDDGYYRRGVDFVVSGLRAQAHV
jgi:AcrR family transcriptional regulator